MPAISFGTEDPIKKVTLLQLLTAFLEDNNKWLDENAALGQRLSLTQETSRINPANEKQLNDFITVIAGKDLAGGVKIDPSSVFVFVSNELLGKLNKTLNNKDNNELLIGWLNEVLQESGFTPLSAGDQKSITDTTGQLVIFYDSDSVKNEYKSLNPVNTDKITGSKLEDTFQENITQRIQMQDDVFSFRFRGSLVESLSVEKLETPTLTKLQAIQNYAEGVSDNANDIKKTASTNKTDATFQDPVLTQVAYRSNGSAVTFKDKQNSLNILYAAMSGASITAIGHPWVRIGKPIGIKGTGFFDGRYLVTKIKHSITKENKFTTEINACRILSQADQRKNSQNLLDKQNLALYGSLNLSMQVNDNSVQKGNYEFKDVKVDNTRVASIANIKDTLVKKDTIDKYMAPLYSLHPKYRQLFIDFINNINLHSEYNATVTKAYIPLSDTFANGGNFSLLNYGLGVQLQLENKTTGEIIDGTKSANVWLSTRIPTEFAATSFHDVVPTSTGIIWGGVNRLTNAQYSAFYKSDPSTTDRVSTFLYDVTYFGLDHYIQDNPYILLSPNNLLDFSKKSLGFSTDYKLTQKDYESIVGNKIAL